MYERAKGLAKTFLDGALLKLKFSRHIYKCRTFCATPRYITIKRGLTPRLCLASLPEEIIREKPFLKGGINARLLNFFPVILLICKSLFTKIK